VRGNADELVPSQNLSSVFEGKIILSQMDTVGINRFRDIGVVVHDKYAPRPFHHARKFV
jgi:hypothetical protein